jgi:pyruvate dehydrogenase E1 component alpha subunit|nr:pyruvate dehydrogenase (acetyl-transferring) E1 component subunit alpha [Candidatus Nucleicultrix amoebiphila]
MAQNAGGAALKKEYKPSVVSEFHAHSFPKIKLSKEELLKHYRMMLLIRRFEERAGQIYGMGKIAGFCHLYIGQEAVVTGLQSCLTEKDTIVTAYRDHGHMLACGMDPKGVMAELTGRIGGYSKGKGGSMHMFSREKNFFGGHGIVGAQVPIGTGLAFAHKYRKDGGLCVTYMGDGAVNQGQVYEAFNMAALWQLPVIYIIENNQYSMGTAVARHAAMPHELYNRGIAYGIKGYPVNGMDILEVEAAGRMAVDHVRSGKGPIILEMKTYRYRGHSMSDPGKYRSKEEVESVKEQADPLSLLQSKLEKEFKVSEAEFKTFEKEIKEIMVQTIEFAETSPEPDASELFTDIYVGETPQASDKSASEPSSSGSSSIGW